MTYQIHTADSAPEDSKPLLEKSVASFGMIPNLHGVMAESPQALEGYQTLHSLAQQTAFNADELTVVWQTINVEHACHYCVPAHSAIAKKMGVDDSLVAALRNREAMPTARLQALHDTVLLIVRERGVVAKDKLNAFYEAGYSHRNVLDIILILAQKVMSNYTNHVGETELDKAFAAFK